MDSEKRWNWQQDDWPQFRFDRAVLQDKEAKFLFGSGLLLGTFRHIREDDKSDLTVDLISDEAVKTSEIEGEFLNRGSVQSSIRRNFGLDTDRRRIPSAEQGIADMMTDLYRGFAEPLAHERLFRWHRMLTSGRTDLRAIGAYRTREDPMQIVSGPINKRKVHFEAPPSATVQKEMDVFITWFNGSGTVLPALTRAGIAHLYFVTIHPFEDGNGRIARALSEKALSQALGQSTFIALSQIIQRSRKAYYEALQRSSFDNEITEWLVYFADTVLEAQNTTQRMIDFLIQKTKLYDRYKGQLNERQEKAIARIFREGLEGFKGGLSAENYISITGASRATTTRDLQDLVDKGVLRRTGTLKSTRYHLDIDEAKKETPTTFQ
ncbi:MAG: Fic family protein [Candidatus Binatia bacterium]